MKQYSNPILSGFYPDPSICRVGEDYYLVTSTFCYFPGIPVFHSKDLVNWTIISFAINRLSQADFTGLGVSKGIFAPTIRFHDDRFYITCTLVDGGGNFIVTSNDAAGPWSDIIWLPSVEGIDPSIFFDGDNAWIIYNSVAPGNKPDYNGHRTIRMMAFNIHQLTTQGEGFILVNGGTDLSKKPRWIEGPHLFKKDGWYYLIAAEGGTGYDHSVVAFRSRNVMGPFEPFENNPVLKQNQHRDFPVTSTGHADLVETPSGNWHAVFLGCRPYKDDYYNTGRETFLVPVTWINGWPILNHEYEKVEIQYPLPLPEIKTVSNNYSGNFFVHENFKDPFPGSDWMFLRSPKDKWFETNNGTLLIKLRPETCSGFGNPSFIARRQQHLDCIVSCGLDFKANTENEKAGLIVFQNEDHFYYLCLSIEDGKPAIQLFQSVLIPRDGCRMNLLLSKKFAEWQNTQLRIVCNRESYSFYYSLTENNWMLLTDAADAKFLSTATAGGFVGCVFGMYATSMGRESNNVVTFRSFEYKSGSS
jgi:xylan 1,4-beta-xylosidase